MRKIHVKLFALLSTSNYKFGALLCDARAHCLWFLHAFVGSVSLSTKKLYKYELRI